MHRWILVRGKKNDTADARATSNMAHLHVAVTMQYLMRDVHWRCVLILNVDTTVPTYDLSGNSAYATGA